MVPALVVLVVVLEEVVSLLPYLLLGDRALQLQLTMEVQYAAGEVQSQNPAAAAAAAVAAAVFQRWGYGCQKCAAAGH